MSPAKAGRLLERDASPRRGEPEPNPGSHRPRARVFRGSNVRDGAGDGGRGTVYDVEPFATSACPGVSSARSRRGGGGGGGHRRSNRAKTRDGLETRRARCVRGEGGERLRASPGVQRLHRGSRCVEGRVRPSGVFVLALARRVAFVFVVSRRPSLPLLSFALVGFTWVWLLSPCSSF